jgi:hypothetical protein
MILSKQPSFMIIKHVHLLHSVRQAYILVVLRTVYCYGARAFCSSRCSPAVRTSLLFLWQGCWCEGAVPYSGRRLLP